MRVESSCERRSVVVHAEFVDALKIFMKRSEWRDQITNESNASPARTLFLYVAVIDRCVVDSLYLRDHGYNEVFE